MPWGFEEYQCLHGNTVYRVCVPRNGVISCAQSTRLHDAFSQRHCRRVRKLVVPSKKLKIILRQVAQYNNAAWLRSPLTRPRGSYAVHASTSLQMPG